MYAVIEFLAHAVRERTDRFERGVARRRADRRYARLLRAHRATHPATQPATEPLAGIPPRAPAGRPVTPRRSGLGQPAS